MASWLGHCLLLLFSCLCCGDKNERKCASPESPMSCGDGQQAQIVAAYYDSDGYCNKDVCESEKLFMNDSTICEVKESHKCYPSFNSTQIPNVYRQCPSNKPCPTWQRDKSSSARTLCVIYICANVKDTIDPCQKEKQQSMTGLFIKLSRRTGTCQRVCAISPDDERSDLHMESNFVDESDVNHIAYRVVDKVNTDTAKWITMDRFYRRYNKVPPQQEKLEIRFCFANVTNILRLWISFGDPVCIHCRDAENNAACPPAVSESTQPAVSEHTTTTIATAVLEENETRVLTTAVPSAVVVALAFGIVLLVFFYKRHKKLRREAHTTLKNSPETPSLSADGSNLPAAPRTEATQSDYEEVEPEKSDVRVDESPAGGRVSQRRSSDYEEADDVRTRPDTGDRNVSLGNDCAAHTAIAGYASCTPASAFRDDGLYRQLTWRQGEERQRETEIVYNHTVNPQVTGDNPDNSCGQTTQSADDLYDLLRRQRGEVVIDNVYNTTEP